MEAISVKKDELYKKILTNRKEANYNNFNRETILKTIENEILSIIKEDLFEIDIMLIKRISQAVLPQEMLKAVLKSPINLEELLQKELDLRLKVETKFKDRSFDKTMDITLRLIGSKGAILDSIALELEDDFMREDIGDFLNENSTLKDFVDFSEVRFDYKNDRNPFQFILNYYYDTTPSVKED